MISGTWLFAEDGDRHLTEMGEHHGLIEHFARFRVDLLLHGHNAGGASGIALSPASRLGG